MSDDPAPVSGKRFARWLFFAAAAFNFVVGLALLLLRPQLAGILRLDPIAGTNLVLLYITCGFILLFGYAYVLVASDPVRYRPYIPLAAIGKLIAVASAVASAVAPWLAGQVSAAVPTLAGGDLVFAALFLLYLRRFPAP